jgi:membrane-associated phospholipid phosphatase
MKAAGMLTILILIVCPLAGQTGNDSLTRISAKNYGQFVLPALLMAGSVVLYAEPVKQDIQRIFPNTRTSVDDWLRYAPVAELYLFDLMGFKHRNSVAIQTVNLGISQLITSGLVTFLKRSVHAHRPSGGIHSFPSGHTSTAFVGATLLYHEFRDTEPILAWSGFALATATGLLRVTNDAHWLPDVMAGAAVGMAVTFLICQVNPTGFIDRMNKNVRLSYIREGNFETIGLCLLF